MNNKTNINYTDEQIFSLYRKIPKDLRNMIKDENFGIAMQITGKGFGLTALQSLDLEDSVVHVFLGIIKREDLLQDIVNKLNISSDIAQKIIASIDENIFSDVKESLLKVSSDTNFETERENKGIKSTKIPIKNIEQHKSNDRKNAIAELTRKIPTPQVSTEEKKVNITPFPSTNEYSEKISTVPVPPKPTDTTTVEKINIDAQQEEHIFEKKLRETIDNRNQKEGEFVLSDTNSKDPYRESL